MSQKGERVLNLRLDGGEWPFTEAGLLELADVLLKQAAQAGISGRCNVQLSLGSRAERWQPTSAQARRVAAGIKTAIARAKGLPLGKVEQIERDEGGEIKTVETRYIY